MDLGLGASGQAALCHTYHGKHLTCANLSLNVGCDEWWGGEKAWPPRVQDFQISDPLGVSPE